MLYFPRFREIYYDQPFAVIHNAFHRFLLDNPLEDVNVAGKRIEDNFAVWSLSNGTARARIEIFYVTANQTVIRADADGDTSLEIENFGFFQEIASLVDRFGEWLVADLARATHSSTNHPLLSFPANPPSGKGGRPRNEDDDWAWEQVHIHRRTVSDVHAEWQKRNLQKGRHPLVDEERSFRHAISRTRMNGRKRRKPE